MKAFALWMWRTIRGLPLALVAPFLLAFSALALFLADLLSVFLRRRDLPPSALPSRKAVSIVIPNWNGRDLLTKYLPSVLEAISRHPGSEVVVIDNGSSDGSAAMLAADFPEVRTLALPKNLGFGGGSNAGFRAASNDIVVLLNSDMRVEPDFIAPLLEGFTDPDIFAVSCQIFFSDPAKLREETGLTEGWWSQGMLQVGHRNDDWVREAYPCFYGGGGSCAFDRHKFLELGGFDELLAPFYLEDTDLGYRAWKRGWRVLYQPASHVYHEHRGTIGKKFSEDYIQSILKKNFLLFTWKNIHEWGKLLPHFFFVWANATISWLFGNVPSRPSNMGILRAFLQLPGAIQSRLQARGESTISDTEAFRRPLGGVYRDTFAAMERQPERLSVLFVSPYPICPPVHGGGVFMFQTIRELARHCDLHLIVLLDKEDDREAHEALEKLCASVEYIVRMEGRSKALGSTEPHALREFRNRDLAWLIHRQIATKRVDIVQLEYTVLGQYLFGMHRIPSILFEHDVYFQSIGRRLDHIENWIEKIQARWEYLRALRYELRMLPRADRIQVCSAENAAYLESFLPQLRGRIDPEFRAGIDTADYEFRTEDREPYTLLFLGSFRHAPNMEALLWFANEVLPLVQQREPRVRLIVIGSDPPPRHSLPENASIKLIGFVDNVREPLGRYAVFVCPIKSGSGVRVKLLEAFAAGIAVVSTKLGAEGLATDDGDVCALADDPQAFADRCLKLIEDRGAATEMARRARAFVEDRRDMRRMTERLHQNYRDTVRAHR